MTRFAPLWLQDGSYPAQLDRQLVTTLWPNGAAGSFTVDIGASAVTISSGRLVAKLADGTSALLYWDAPETVPVPPDGGVASAKVLVAQLAANPDGAPATFGFEVLSGPLASAPGAPDNAVQIASWQTNGSNVISAGPWDTRPATFLRPWEHIPAGPQGPQGPSGPLGPTGPQGAPAALPGGASGQLLGWGAGNVMAAQGYPLAGGNVGIVYWWNGSGWGFYGNGMGAAQKWFVPVWWPSNEWQTVHLADQLSSGSGISVDKQGADGRARISVNNAPVKSISTTPTDWDVLTLPVWPNVTTIMGATLPADWNEVYVEADVLISNGGADWAMAEVGLGINMNSAQGWAKGRDVSLQPGEWQTVHLAGRMGHTQGQDVLWVLATRTHGSGPLDVRRLARSVSVQATEMTVVRLGW